VTPTRAPRAVQRVKQALLGIDNVARVIPMGMREAIVASQGLLDKALGSYATSSASSPPRATPELLTLRAARKDSYAGRSRSWRRPREGQGHRQRELLRRARPRRLRRAVGDELWRDYDRDPGRARVPREPHRAAVGRLGLPLDPLRRHDLQSYTEAFDRHGGRRRDAVPEGERGILLAKLYAEDMLKLKNARPLARSERSAGRAAASPTTTSSRAGCARTPSRRATSSPRSTPSRSSG